MSSKPCPRCNSTEVASGPSVVCCADCGYVLTEGEIVNQQTFSETSSGGASADGQWVSASGRSYRGGVPGLGRVSREVTVDNARKRIQNLAAVLGLSAYHVDAAVRFFNLALQHNFVKGRRSENVVSACLYVVCRLEKTSHMLLDFADILNTNVYILGHTFLNFCALLNLELPIIDPSLYINRFAAKLGFEDKVQQVATTALRLVQRMRRDWIITGRRPSGICGAALLIAARVHGFHRTVSEVVSVVKMGEVTIRKRLSEFEITASSKLTPEEFNLIELEQEMDPPCYTRGLKQAQMKKKKQKERERKKKKKKQGRPSKKKQKTKGKKGKGKKKGSKESEEGESEEEVDPLLAPPTPPAPSTDSSTATPATPNQMVTAELEKEMQEMIQRSEFVQMEDDVNTMLEQTQDNDELPDLPPLIPVKGKEKEDEEDMEGIDGTQREADGETEALPGNSGGIDEGGASVAEVPSSVASNYMGPTDPAVQVHDPYWKEGEPFYWEMMDEDDGNLSEFEDEDIDKYIYTPEEALARKEIWEELNKDYLKELEEKKKQEAIDFPNGKPPRATRKRKRSTKPTTAADTPGKAAATVLEKKVASSKINYKALESLLTESAFEESRAREERLNTQKASQTSTQTDSMPTVQKKRPITFSTDDLGTTARDAITDYATLDYSALAEQDDDFF